MSAFVSRALRHCGHEVTPDAGAGRLGRARRARRRRVITKPFTLEEICAAVDEELAR